VSGRTLSLLVATLLAALIGIGAVGAWLVSSSPVGSNAAPRSQPVNVGIEVKPR